MKNACEDHSIGIGNGTYIALRTRLMFTFRVSGSTGTM
jgi:hypothetical protein